MLVVENYHLSKLFLGMRNIGGPLGVVHLRRDPLLDLLGDEEEGGGVGVLAHLHMMMISMTMVKMKTAMVMMTMVKTGLHKLWYPGIQDTSTWSKFGAHGEHGDVFLFSNLGAL